MANSNSRSKQRSGSTKAPAGKSPAGKARGGKGAAPPAKRPGASGRVAAKSAAATSAEPFPRSLLGAGLLIGLYAMLPTFYLAGIHPKHNAEIVDHFVPGMFVLAMVIAAVIRQAKPDTLMLSTGVVVLLAGFWMAATHYGLLSEAIDNNKMAPWPGTLYHCSTAVAVFALGITWVYRYRAAGSGVPDRKTAAARRF